MERQIELHFANVATLEKWLKNKNFECENMEKFYKYLQNFFDNGNSIIVNGEEYDYWSCWELT